ncbi:aminotransferase class I/II-fold pyridoxal phosphate-dependent enzyme [Pareuzebyella sediminis]|uniref:aminotransferase class I/II-fold pyridoxal phosphate-dependent enzyme n=1 Tax=Pareuzebyella sediminis TaxID=2607998 RepID=UPI0011EE9E16|nr:8-amino-7-oxononanoate synthase [Pareuzebyella sediminis]
MDDLPKKLRERLSARSAKGLLRSLPGIEDLIDFSSNDYLGLSNISKISEMAAVLLEEKGLGQGATGSRLISGNHSLYAKLEETLATVHKSESALVFNSGYDANIGFFSAVPQHGDVILYDEYIHASIRDGIQLAKAKSYKFSHNDAYDLQEIVVRLKERGQMNSGTEVYVVTESVFSMDGDSPDLKVFADNCREQGFHLVVDEAHAIGVLGNNGTGLVQKLDLETQVFARIVTFGKAIGSHGAAVLGGKSLRDYLINFARSFIYTTGLPPHSIAATLASYNYLVSSGRELNRLRRNIELFNSEIERLQFNEAGNGAAQVLFLPSSSAIHSCIIPGNLKVRSIAFKIRAEGFDVRAIMAPTVPEGRERLRFCLHSFNSKEEIVRVLQLLAIFTKEV